MISPFEDMRSLSSSGRCANGPALSPHVNGAQSISANVFSMSVVSVTKSCICHEFLFRKAHFGVPGNTFHGFGFFLSVDDRFLS